MPRRFVTGLAFIVNHDHISDGYDGGFDTTPSHNEYLYGETATPFTPAERAELAEYMIALWTAFKTAGDDAEK